MKRSMAVTLVISGALMAGCDDPTYAGRDWSSDGQPITNNTYVAGQGYWHAPYRAWYPYPYDYYRPGFGFFHGGLYSPAPEASPILASVPDPGAKFGPRGGLAAGDRAGVARGGFGSSARGGRGG
jgi:hypothetical protein